MSATIDVVEKGRPMTFSFDDLMKYHGPGSPGGVAMAFKVMERGFALLDPEDPLERREVTLATSFGGPGARDGFEMVTRAVTGGRFEHDPSLARPQLGRERERFVFQLGYRDRSVTLVLRDGYVLPEFIDLARTQDPSADEQARLEFLKAELAERVMAAEAAAVYDAE
jgi:hypothetical protein